MSKQSSVGPRPLPKGVMMAVSLGLLVHLSAIVVHCLAASSGPWLSPIGPSMAEPPEFAKPLDNLANRYYLRPLQMTHNYHFETNTVNVPGVYFEAILRDTAGKEIKKVRYPDPAANFWVRHRQARLAQGLAQDREVRPRGADVIYDKNKAIPTHNVWQEMTPGDYTNFKLITLQENHIPRDRVYERPSEWSRLLANSYMRYFKRKEGAASVEILRHVRGSLSPEYLLSPEDPSEMFGERISHFVE